MTEPVTHPASPLRTWRPMAAWTAGILLALGLAWFVGAVVVPVWQVRVLMTELRGGSSMDEETAIRRLGGPTTAARKLAFYRRLPQRIASDKYSPRIFEVLGKCGPAAVPPLIEAVREEQGPVRLSAIKALVRQVPLAPEAAQALTEALTEEWEPIHCYAIEGLMQIGPPAACAIPALERELLIDKGHCEWARPDLAAEALWTIAPERLLAHLHDPSPERRADAVDRVAGIAKSHRDVRAIEALAGLGKAATAAVPYLETLASDGTESVRAAAAEALKKIRGEEAKP